MPRLAPARTGAPASLQLRILSALVLAPIAIGAAWFGSPWLPLLTALAAAGMAWEWARMCNAGRLGGSGVALIGIVLVPIATAALARAISPAVLVSLSGAACVWGVARLERAAAPFSLAFGALWVTLPCVLLLWLADTGAGRITVLWIFAVVWATDIGAYAIGRRFGGPRLAPRWSPRKTWTGLIGGAGCAALAGWGTARALMYIDPGGLPSVLPLVLASAGLAIVEQFGDLAESVAKRRFGVKDSSGLIPGHGGLLDRLDGLLAVIPAVALLTLIGGGSVLTWRWPGR